MSLTYTNAAYIRSHMKAPRNSANNRGTWAFQQTRRDTAFVADLMGDMVFVPYCTLAEAKRTLKAQGRTGTWAVMP